MKKIILFSFIFLTVFFSSQTKKVAKDNFDKNYNEYLTNFKMQHGLASYLLKFPLE